MKIRYYLFFLITINSCQDRSKEINVDLTFLGNGDFEICFKNPDDPFDKFKSTTFTLTTITKSGKTRKRESLIYSSCIKTDFIQLKLGAYTVSELNEMESEFIPGNIKEAIVEIYYGNEYDSPFVKRTFKDL